MSKDKKDAPLPKLPKALECFNEINGPRIGRRMKAARNACGMSGIKAAKYISVTPAFLYTLETGKARVFSLEKICHLCFIYGASVTDIVADLEKFHVR